MKLLLSATVKYLAGVFLVGTLLFLPAGTFDFAGAWLLMGLLFIPMLLLGFILFFKSPELLKKRINGKEDESTQKGVVAVAVDEAQILRKLTSVYPAIGARTYLILFSAMVYLA